MMRTLLATAAVLTIAAATTAEAADRVVVRRDQGASSRSGDRAGYPDRPRWGGRIQGRWWAGSRAPGGWSAYQRPVRGRVLPSYWVSPGWYISDWSGYGLPRPPVGYNWSRYYDDAVLIDGRGGVQDTIGGVDWDQDDPDGIDYTYYDQGYDAPSAYNGYSYGEGYRAEPPVDSPGAPYPYPPRESDGLAGAAVGAAVGGIAGAVIGGRDNRLGGALIGGGAGALAGYAIDKSENRAPPPPPPHYGADYPAPYGGYPPAVATRAPSPPMPVYSATSPVVTAAPGVTIVTTSGGYGAGGYTTYAVPPGGGVTTITVQGQPVVTTTTTTETWETRSR